MSLHDKIMNIPCEPDNAKKAINRIEYKKGHFDARHRAAELAIEYDELLEQLQDLNNELFKQLNKTLTDIELSNECFGDMDAMRRIIERCKNEK